MTRIDFHMSNHCFRWPLRFLNKYYGHIRITEERKAARRLQRSQSATLLKFASDLTLDNRKLSREKRGKPWSEETPKYIKPCTVIPGMTKQKSVELKKMLKLEDAWLEERNAEMWAISRVTPTFQPITLVLVSSELYHNSSAEVIHALRDSEDILPIIYDHTAGTFTEVIDLMKKSLKSVASGIKAERLVILCHGGPGHMFLFKKQIITSGKIRRDSDIKWFWQQVGRLMSKRDSTQTQVLIGGFDMIGAANSGKEFMKDLMTVMKPNKVQVLALPISQKLTDQTQKNMVHSIFTSLDAYNKLLYKDPHNGKDQAPDDC